MCICSISYYNDIGFFSAGPAEPESTVSTGLKRKRPAPYIQHVSSVEAVSSFPRNMKGCSVVSRFLPKPQEPHTHREYMRWSHLSSTVVCCPLQNCRSQAESTLWGGVRRTFSPHQVPHSTSAIRHKRTSRNKNTSQSPQLLSSPSAELQVTGEVHLEWQSQ